MDSEECYQLSRNISLDRFDESSSIILAYAVTVKTFERYIFKVFEFFWGGFSDISHDRSCREAEVEILIANIPVSPILRLFPFPLPP